MSFIERLKAVGNLDAGFPGTMRYLESIGQRPENIAIFFKDKILDNPNQVQAENFMQIMEAKEAEIQVEFAAIKQAEANEIEAAKQAWIRLKSSPNDSIQDVVKVIKRIVKKFAE